MLPSRSQLQGWNPDSLTGAASAVRAGGESVYIAVRDLEDDCHRLPEARTWSGKSHDAAEAMFGRATQSASQFSHYTDGVAAALEKGATAIGGARQGLLQEADHIDAGELQVTDQWVVLIKPAQMSAEKAAQLLLQAAQDQAEINRLLLALGDADSATAAAVEAAAKDFGFQPPDTTSPFYGMRPGEIPPGDQVPDPRFPMGLLQQGLIRDQDMATTVRATSEFTDSDGQVNRTLTMLDGSRHEIKEWGTYNPSTEDAYYDKSGKLVSATLSQQQYDGTQFTSITFGDGTNLTMTRTADGKTSGGVTTPDGRHGLLPDEFFSHPNLTLAGGALTGLDKQAALGIPMLNAGQLEKVHAGVKFAGPALGVATALYDTVTAATFEDACVAAISGGAGLAGGEAGAWGAGAAAAALLPEVPGAIPIAAAGGSMLGGWTFGYVGGIIGNIVCRP